jgi:hypothetical protein
MDKYVKWTVNSEIAELRETPNLVSTLFYTLFDREPKFVPGGRLARLAAKARNPGAGADLLDFASCARYRTTKTAPDPCKEEPVPRIQPPHLDAEVDVHGSGGNVPNGFASVFAPPRPRRATTVLVALVVLLVACGPGDYQKPIKEFQDAANIVIAADRAFLDNANSVEENLFIDQRIFERKTFSSDDVEKQAIITPEEIKLRTDALDALAQYTTSLATLANGKSDTTSGEKMKDSSSSLQSSASKASSQPGATKDQKAFNEKFSGLATAAAAAIGAVAQAILQHKAHNEIKKSVRATDKDVTVLISFIGDDAQGFYLRQRSQLGIYGVQLDKIYQCEVDVNERNDKSATDPDIRICSHVKDYQADPALLLNLGDRLKSYRQQQALLEKANPEPAIEKLQKAHEALVAYVTGDKNSKKLSDVIDEVNSLVAAAKPLEQAIHSLISAKK